MTCRKVSGKLGCDEVKLVVEAFQRPNLKCFSSFAVRFNFAPDFYVRHDLDTFPCDKCRKFIW